MGVQIVDGAVQDLQLFVVARQQRRCGILELRFGLGGQLVDRLHVGRFGAFDVGEGAVFEQVRVGDGVSRSSFITVEPDTGNRDEQGESPY